MNNSLKHLFDLENLISAYNQNFMITGNSVKHLFGVEYLFYAYNQNFMITNNSLVQLQVYIRKNIGVIKANYFPFMHS